MQHRGEMLCKFKTSSSKGQWREMVFSPPWGEDWRSHIYPFTESG